MSEGESLAENDVQYLNMFGVGGTNDDTNLGMAFDDNFKCEYAVLETGQFRVTALTIGYTQRGGINYLKFELNSDYVILDKNDPDWQLA